jgi:3'-phosphoadenosine 5'-phosphosulfate sulfotransferase (PAPS reductase)/FAD synthetase
MHQQLAAIGFGGTVAELIHLTEFPAGIDVQQPHLRQLEAESIHIIREVAAEFSNPVMMYSIGKDSSASADDVC